MKRTHTSRAFLSAVCALLLFGSAAFAKDGRTTKSDAELRKNDLTADQFRVIKDLPYGNKSPSQKLDILIPSVPYVEASDKSRSGRPLLVYIHGGGWRGGDKEHAPAKAFLNEGFAVASLNYRLSGQAKWPAQFDDCCSALTYLRQHAHVYGINPKRICLWGGSAGGHLVLMLALKSGNPAPADEKNAASLSSPGEIAAVCDWYGPTDLSRFKPREDTTPQGAEMVQQLFGLEGDALTAACLAASPITYVGKSKKMPPLLIMHGTKDDIVSIRQARTFVKKMKDCGQKNLTYVEIDGGHGGPGFERATVMDVVDFFKGKLK